MHYNMMIQQCVNLTTDNQLLRNWRGPVILVLCALTGGLMRKILTSLKYFSLINMEYENNNLDKHGIMKIKILINMEL